MHRSTAGTRLHLQEYSRNTPASIGVQQEHTCICRSTAGTHLHQGGVVQHFILIFKNWHYAANQVYFQESNSRKSANLGACKAKFLFFNHRDLKNKYFFRKFENTVPLFYFRNNSQISNLNFKIVLQLQFLLVSLKRTFQHYKNDTCYMEMGWAESV